MLFDGVEEAGWNPYKPGYHGKKLFDFLSSPVDDETSEAGQYVHHLLKETCLMKNYRGRGMANMFPSLGSLWDENDGSDAAPGTWARYLRDTSTDNKQTRALLPKVLPRVPKVWSVGLNIPL